LRALLTLLGGAAGVQIARTIIRENLWSKVTAVHPLELTILLAAAFALFGFILAPLFGWSLHFLGRQFERNLQPMGMQEIVAALFGLLMGLLLANLIALPLSNIPGVGVYVAVLLNVTLAYVGVVVFLRRREEIWGILTSIGGIREGIREKLPFRGRRREKGVGAREEIPEPDPGGAPVGVEVLRSTVKILDTSVIIDGRIRDVAGTGFLEGPLALPRFVLAELQGVADSTDPTRRARGRRGLDAVNDLQKIPGLHLEILEVSLRDLGLEHVDEALVALGKRMGAHILTTDYNLNKIAQIEGVGVLNVNDLANALKPMLLPGDSVTVEIIREGKEPRQGVGYLDDGTMIVVEEADRYLGRRVEVAITSMLQTSAGRMAFGRFRRELRA
jgi:uncharacterized protein YacL